MMKEETRKTKGHSKIRELVFKGHYTYSFPHRTVDIWNGLKEEVVTVTNIHKFKEILDKWIYGDRTL